MTADWGGYRAILEEARELERADAESALIDCPICGSILARNAAGVGSCPMGHFRTADATKRNWL